MIRRWLWRLRGLLYFSPGALRLAGVCLLAHVIQQVAARVDFVNVYGYRYGYAEALTGCFGLSWPLLAKGFFWQPATYLFLHEGWGHLAFNVLPILLFGSGLEAEIGGRRFVRLFLTAGVLAGLGWLGVTALSAYLPALPRLPLPSAVQAWLPAPEASATLDTALCVGASGGVFGLIGAYGALFPRRVVYLVLPVPARLRARTLVGVVVVLDLAVALVLRSKVAVAAHLAGCAAGLAYGGWLRRAGVAGDE